MTVPNVKVCRVAGVMDAGADCAWTLSEQKQQMSTGEFITFLEPTHYRGAAFCMPVDHWVRMKTALEQACHALGSKCRPEVSVTIDALDLRLGVAP